MWSNLVMRLRALLVAVLVLVLGAWTCAPTGGTSPGSGGSDVPISTTGLTALVAGEDWHGPGDAGEPSFENGWSSGTESVAYRLREPGIVDMKGSVTGGTPGSTIFTLPAGYRPALQFSYTVFGLVGSTPSVGLLTIETSGAVHGERLGATEHDDIYVAGSFFLNVA